MYNLIEYCYNYSKTSGSLWQYYKDELDAAIVNSESFKFKTRIIGKTSADCNTTDVKIAVPLKYVRHFWRNTTQQCFSILEEAKKTTLDL